MKLDSFAAESLKALQAKINAERAKQNLSPLNQSQVVSELLSYADAQSAMYIGSVFIRGN